MRKLLSRPVRYRGNRKAYMAEIKALEWASKEEIRAYQEERLSHVLMDARMNVPYYRARAKGNGLSDFPILTRREIKTHRDELIVQSRINERTKEDTTSGTTSVPLAFLLDHEHRERGAVLKLFFNEWAGHKLGDSMIKFWGIFDADTWRKRWRNRISLWLRNMTVLKVFDMRPEVMEAYARKMERIQPKLLLAYTNSLYEFAKYLNRRGRKVDLHGAIMVSSSSLTPEKRKMIDAVFSVPIFDRYGTREMMDVACDCDRHEGLHVCPYLQMIEIVDEQGNPCPPGVSGRILLTQLHNSVMPLIRYDTSDYGTWAEEPCSCGRNWPMIKQIDGRAISMFRERHGGRSSSYYITHHVDRIFGEETIRRQQIIQTDYNRFTVRLVLYEPKAWPRFVAEREELERIVSKLQGELTKISYELVDEIPNQPSGKYLQTICTIPEEEP